MLGARSDRGFATIRLAVLIGQRSIAISTLVNERPGLGRFFANRLRLARVRRVAVNSRFAAVQQVGDNLTVMDVRGVE